MSDKNTSINSKTEKSESEEFVIKIDLKELILPISIFVSMLLSALMISLVIAGGFNNLSETIKNTGINQGQNNTASEQSEPENFTVNASIDDDPFLGDPNAPVTIIEFAAYDCPFCQRHAIETLPSLKRDYIDKGLVKYVFRDSPLSGGGQNYQANVANCAKKVGGGSDEVYFKFHDLIYRFFEDFRNTAERDKVNAEISTLASSLGLDGGSIISCAASAEFSSEVEADQQALSQIAQTMGLSGLGVPTFIVGKASSDGTITTNVTLDRTTGNIEGGLINGAWPFERFQEQINQLL